MLDTGNLIGWQKALSQAAPFRTWKPRPLSHEQWPPDYAAVYAWRIKTLQMLRKSPEALADAKRYYATHKTEFIMHWMDTYDPRIKTGNKWVPFVFFEKQADFIDYLDELRIAGENGLCEKARDMGMTWASCAYSVTCWLFIDNDAIGWGSRKQELVDKLGDVSSIFEKLRMIVRRLPDVFKPSGLRPKEHLTFMKCINPENGSTITGETGDNIGRGGRTAMYFKDESAHYERPEKIEAALGDNTNCQIDISSVNGIGNVFYRRRMSGVIWERGKVIEHGYTRVFVMDWRDHPEKTQAWYDARKAKYAREGMDHIFAQEVDRSYENAVGNKIIPFEWAQACVDAHLKIPYLRIPPPNVWGGALDVADGGIDRNALALRQWIIIRNVEEWGERDPGVTTRRAMEGVRGKRGIVLQYDAIGIGASVKSEYNRLVDEANAADDKRNDGKRWEFYKLPKLTAWNAGASVLDPHERIIPDDDDSLTNFDMFGNLKAQGWWSLRTRAYKTFKAVSEGIIYPPDELISLDSQMPLIHQLCQELSQPVRASSGQLKTIVDKTPEGMKSPNLGDAVMMAMFPVPDDYATFVIGGRN